MITVHQGNCIDVLKQYPDHYFDAIITDPPFGMTSGWTHGTDCMQMLADYGLLRVLHPDGTAIVLTNPMPGFILYKNQRQRYVNRPVMEAIGIERSVDDLRGLIRRTSGRILDPFMGTGTTLIAAELEHRDAVGIDIEAVYCHLAQQRLGRMKQYERQQR